MIIKDKNELEKLLNSLESQGFGHIRAYKLHDSKIENIISKENKNQLNNFDRSTLMNKISKETNYNKIEEITKNHFSKFTDDDKIKEVIGHFGLVHDTIRVPYRSANYNEIKSWFYEKKKYKIPNNKYDKGDYIRVYNLDKNILKVYFSGYDWDNIQRFSKLYELIFNEKPNDFSTKYSSVQDLGKISIKIYAKGTTDIKGDIKKLKDEYFKYYNNNIKTIIIYNNNYYYN